MLEPLDTLPDGLPERSLVWSVLEWAYGNAYGDPSGQPRFVVPDGTAAGEPLRLTDRQLRFFAWLWALDRADRWLCRGAMSRHARGAGKSPGAGFYGCCELLGPVRPSGYSYAASHPLAGQPIGRRVNMPLVQVAATSMDQTANVMNYVQSWIGKGSVLAHEYGLEPGATLVRVPTMDGVKGGMLRAITSSSTTVRGARPTATIADELGDWTSENGGTKLWSVMGDNASKVPYSRVYGLGNAWAPGSGSVAEMLWQAFESERGGARVEAQYLMDVREAPADTDWSERDSVVEALAVVYLDVPWIDQRDLLTTIMDPGKEITESQREYGNWRVALAENWTDAPTLLRNVQPAEVALADGDTIVLACDPSDTSDATGLVGCRMDDGLTQVLWSYEPNRTGKPVPYDELDMAVTDAFDRYDVVGFLADVHPAEHLVKVVWPERYGHRLLIEGAPGEPVAFDNRRHRLEMLRATEQAETELLAGEWPYAVSEVLTRHALNAFRRPSVGYVGVRKGDADHKIDLLVTAIMARLARRRVQSSKGWAKRNRNREVVVLA
jgi:hypothetical protein